MYHTMKTGSYAEKYRLRTPPKPSGHGDNSRPRKGLHTKTRSELLLNVQLQVNPSQGSLQIKPSPPENAVRKIVHRRALSDYVTQSKPVLNLKSGDSEPRAGEETHTPSARLTFPMTPSVALRHCSGQLTTYEQSEILCYPVVYFLGAPQAKVKPNIQGHNRGFDNEAGYYQTRVGDHIAFRYEILKVLGQGSFGQVLKTRDHKDGRCVAVKIIRNSPKFHRQAVVELKVLNVVKRAPEQCNLVQVCDSFVFRNHPCMTFELLGINLYEFLRINHFRGLREHFVKGFAQHHSLLAHI